MSEKSWEHPVDPRRRLRRHRYQEGPSFLFLAALGGRPPGSLARDSLREVRRRMRAVRLAGEASLEAAVAAGYSRRSVFRWIQLSPAPKVEGQAPGSSGCPRLGEQGRHRDSTGDLLELK